MDDAFCVYVSLIVTTFKVFFELKIFAQLFEFLKLELFFFLKEIFCGMYKDNCNTPPNQMSGLFRTIKLSYNLKLQS